MLCFVLNNAVQTVSILNLKSIIKLFKVVSVFLFLLSFICRRLCVFPCQLLGQPHIIFKINISNGDIPPTSHYLNTGKHTKYQNLISKFVALGISAFKTRLSTDKKILLAIEPDLFSMPLSLHWPYLKTNDKSCFNLLNILRVPKRLHKNKGKK